ncbi:MAG TPA: response regulator transcription factor [Spirochaetota bacterium]|nr:response regulator transcription factor [Spirochaetota bacterium]HPF05773.1 response regulator transcription factor [Spirochaetota bacterium]HPJ42480.1 response regulator transcription factor [Spirochaetota bacterium]HPR37413.1 response regulator transcription factor [Spirochaetota bacterium]HRX47310.1 response regulator transcription factor [Spirochaetota bacterium]
MAEGMLKSSRKNKIFIVEDHPIFRDGISQLINKEEDMCVVGGCENSNECLKYLKDNNPDLVIVDITLKDSCGIELTKEIKKTFPSLPVLILSMHEELIFADRVLKAGARGYMTKREATGKVIEAIRRVLQGKIYICDTMIDHFLERSITGGQNFNSSPVEKLSEREFEVFNLIGKGMTNRNIAEVLSVSTNTISTYRERIKEKLNLQNNAELNRYAMQWIQN